MRVDMNEDVIIHEDIKLCDELSFMEWVYGFSNELSIKELEDISNNLSNNKSSKKEK